MSLGAKEGREKFPALYNLSIDISKKGFKTTDLLSAVLKADGSAMNLTNRLSQEFDLKDELLSGRVKGMAETDCLATHDKAASKRTSLFYN